MEKQYRVEIKKLVSRFWYSWGSGNALRELAKCKKDIGITVLTNKPELKNLPASFVEGLGEAQELRNVLSDVIKELDNVYNLAFNICDSYSYLTELTEQEKQEYEQFKNRLAYLQKFLYQPLF